MSLSNAVHRNKDRAILLVKLILALCIGVTIGYFCRIASDGYGNKSSYAQDRFKSEISLISAAQEAVNSDSLRNYLLRLTSLPHPAGTKRDWELTEWIREQWLQEGLDRVEFATYDFLLSFPNLTHPNKVSLLDPEGNAVFFSSHGEDEDSIPAFNAYAPTGIAEGQLVYVNYATGEDLQYLHSVGISLKDKIVIARHGSIYRGNKLENCHSAGAIGLILYSDPADAAPFGIHPKDVYPNSIFLPPSGIQRGTVFMGQGDPLSPFWPSSSHAHRLDKEEAKLPQIPCQPISYGDAKVLMEKLGGPLAPQNWKGAMEGVEYRLGGSMLPSFEGWKVRLSVNNCERDEKSSNVIGYMVGDVEPDRYVYVGNHRDAWGSGAMDPSSGTANLMELVRVLGKMRKEFGWRPRRTLVFCSWAAEEYGLMGSEEWVQEKRDKVISRSVGMLNTDMCVTGPIPFISASSSLRDVVYDSLKSVPDWNGRGSVYEVWHEWYNRERAPTKFRKPWINLLSADSDHSAFAFGAGVPAIDMYFTVDRKKDVVLEYPTYHTWYETFHLVDTIVDPGFKIHRACTQLSLQILFRLSDSLMLPYNLALLAADLKKAVRDMRMSKAGVMLAKHNVSLEYVNESVDRFIEAANEHRRFVASLSENSNPTLLRMVNDQLMGLERVFLLPQGLPGGNDNNRHAVFSPARIPDTFGNAAFPGITDLLHGIDELEGEELRSRRQELLLHVSDLMIVIRNAASFLQSLFKI